MSQDTTALVALPPPTIAPMQIVADAIRSGMEPDKLGKLFDLARDWAKDRAAEIYAEALKNFQSQVGPIPKGRAVKNKDGSPRYKYAGFEDVMIHCQPHLSRNGISVSFWTPKEESADFVIVCRLQVGSHCEDRPFRAPKPDMQAIAKSMYMSEPQAFGFVLSYFKRYAFCAAASVTVCDEDNDAVNAPIIAAPLDSEELAELNDLCQQWSSAHGGKRRVNAETFAKIFGGTSLETIPRDRFADACAQLRNDIARAAVGKEGTK